MAHTLPRLGVAVGAHGLRGVARTRAAAALREPVVCGGAGVTLRAHDVGAARAHARVVALQRLGTNYIAGAVLTARESRDKDSKGVGSTAVAVQASNVRLA
jgi:hypothetical protein